MTLLDGPVPTQPTLELPTTESIAALQAKVADLPGFSGLVQRDGKTFATFHGKPPMSVAKEIVRRVRGR